MPVAKQLMLPFIIACLALLIHAGEPASSQFLRYQRDAIAEGEIWRILSGHFCHLGSTHLLLNLLGLGLVVMLFINVLKMSNMLMLLLGSMLGCSAGLWFLTPHVSSYVGLSAALHGLMVGAALLDWGRHRLTNTLLLIGVLAKVLWENSIYYTDSTSQLIGGQVLVQSHLFGAIAGAVIGTVLLAFLTFHIKK